MDEVYKDMFFEDSRFIKIMRMYPQPMATLHSHKFNELVIIMKGTGLHYTEDDEYPVCAGDVFFIKPGMMHGYKDTKNLVITNVLYYPDKLGIPTFSIRQTTGYKVLFELEPEMRKHDLFKSKLHVALDELFELDQIVKDIERELNESKSGALFFATAHLMVLIGRVSRTYEGRPELLKKPLARLSGIFAFIDSNYSKDINLDMLAKTANMSKSTFNRAFKSATGQTPLDFILKKRITRATELFREKDVPISEAAYRTGFSDSNYFSRQFHKITGLSPREFKKSLV